MGKHILVIDDCKMTLDMIEDMLKTAGYVVSTADNVVYCNDIIFKKTPPDLILMDVNLPFMKGDHKTRILKNRPKSSRIPIILISGIAELELQGVMKACGADGFLSKPFSMDDLIATVERFLINAQ